jgi:hypothetical protein
MTTSKISLDINTLLELQKEASNKYDEANELFEDSDSSEAMNEAEGWLQTIHWLSDKIKKQKKSN